MPTIFLRWISPHQIHESYDQWDLTTRTLKTLPQRIYFRSTLFQDQDQEDSQRIYHKIDNNNRVRRFCNRDYELVSYFMNHKSRKCDGGVCNWCRRNFSSPHFGIVIDIQKKVFTSPKGWSKTVTLILEEGIFCRMACAFAEYCRLEDSRHLPIRYNRSRELMNQIHQTMLDLNKIPYYELKPSADFQLLDINGGPLTEEEYFSPYYQFVEIPNNFFIPNSIIYEIVSQEVNWNPK